MADVYIIGASMTPFGRFLEKSVKQLTREAVTAALDDAILEQDGLPYGVFALGSVQTIDVELTYDDLTTESASFERQAVKIP